MPARPRGTPWARWTSGADQYEEHFFDCPECADEVKEAAIFLENAEEVVRSESERAAVIERRRTQPARSPWWGGAKVLFWPVPMGAAATLALILGGPAVYLALHKVPELERALANAEALQPAPSYFLTVSRSELPVVAVSKGESRVALTLSRSSDRSFPFYLCEVRDASDRIALSSVVPAAPQRENCSLLPTDPPAGSPRHAVAGLESRTSRTPASDFTRYNFTFERE
jgi:hypothetical protein